MKLKNKKTGEAMSIYEILTSYDTLAELNEEWEDYEEPKEYWYLSGRGEIRCIEDDGTEFDKEHKKIGNYFESKEEAERAVEKLKAWKRLRDDGFRFLDKIRYGSLCGNGFDITITACMPPEYCTDTETSKDLDLLFGEED